MSIPISKKQVIANASPTHMIINKLLEMFRKIKDKYTEDEIRQLLDLLKSVKNSFEFELPKHYKILFEELALAGWFIDYEIAPKTLAELLNLDYEKKSQLDSYLINYFGSKVDVIRKRIVKNFPTRKVIINSAFKAHLRKEYELSIPVFLSQIDGICFDLTQKDIFSRGKGRNKENLPQKWVDQLTVNKLILSFLEPLRNNAYLSAPFSESKNYPHVLNRNLILHGRETKFATERNSLKAISLLNFIAVFVYDISQKDKTR